MSLAIPIVDLTAADGVDDAALLRGLADFGLVHVRGGGIDSDALDALYDNYRTFTARPTAEKSKLGGADIWFQRGWTPPNTEQAVVAGGQPDFKECYFAVPVDVDPACQIEYPQVFADNVWPPNLDAFRLQYQAIGAQLHAVGLQLLAGVARALKLSSDTFATRVDGGAHVTRLLRYLPLDKTQVGRVLWGEEHTDFNLLTLLPGGRFFDPDGTNCQKPDPTAGLYLRTREGTRVQGIAPPGCITVQVGQQLEILTGGRLQATPHEITAPSQPGYTRCSMAHFIHLHPHQPVRPLPAFCTAKTIRAYGPTVLAGTYGLKTLVDIGLAPASAMDSLGFRHYDRLVEQRQGEDRE